MMSFKSLLSSLSIPLGETSSVFRALFTSIAAEFDSLWQYARNTAERVFPQSGYFLDRHAQCRGITRLPYESDEAYQNRIIYAFFFQTESSTVEGIRHVIAGVSAKPFIIREMFRESWILGWPGELLGVNTPLGSALDRFFFIVEFSEALASEEKTYIESVIELYKPAHVGFRLAAPIENIEE